MKQRSRKDYFSFLFFSFLFYKYFFNFSPFWELFYIFLSIKKIREPAG